MRPVVGVQHAGFGVGTEAARAGRCGSGRVVFGAPKGEVSKRLEDLFELPEKHSAAFDLTGVKTILKPQPLATVNAWLIAWQDAVVQIGQVFYASRRTPARR